MILIETIFVALGMFSALPVPQPIWNRENMRYVMLVFPLIGLLPGGGWLLLWQIGEAWQLPPMLMAGGYCLIPVLLTGGIHLDGYADTWDARSSWGDQEKRQKILKDPHCGAFAVIHLCSYFVVYYALCTALEMETTTLLLMTAAFVLERCLSGVGIAGLPLAKDTGLAHTFAQAADRVWIGGILRAGAILLSVVMILLAPLRGGMMAAAGWLAYYSYAQCSKKEFGGISGDLNGWFLQRAELWMLSALVLGRYLEGLG